MRNSGIAGFIPDGPGTRKERRNRAVPARRTRGSHQCRRNKSRGQIARREGEAGVDAEPRDAKAATAEARRRRVRAGRSAALRLVVFRHERRSISRYHDEEWGVPVHDDRRLFEFLILEGAQAGLSWSTILQQAGGLSGGVRRTSTPRKSRASTRARSSSCCCFRASCATGSRSSRPSRTRAVSSGAGGIRQLRELQLALRRRQADGESAARDAARSRRRRPSRTRSART